MLKWAPALQMHLRFSILPLPMTALKEVCRDYLYYRYREAFSRIFAEKAAAIPLLLAARAINLMQWLTIGGLPRYLVALGFKC